MQSLTFNDDLPVIATTAANEMLPLATPMKNDDDDELFKSLKLVRLKKNRESQTFYFLLLYSLYFLYVHGTYGCRIAPVTRGRQ